MFTKGLWSLRLQIEGINDWMACHATGQILGMHSGASQCPAWHRHQQRWLAHKGNLSRAPIMTICHSPESIEMTNEEQKPCWQVECVALNHVSMASECVWQIGMEWHVKLFSRIAMQPSVMVISVVNMYCYSGISLQLCNCKTGNI